MAEDAFYVNVGPVERIIQSLDNGLQDASALFLEVGAYVKAQIDIRTAEGVDKDERAFEPYVPAYTLFRMESGRSTEPNLFFTGTMMSSMTHSAEANSARIFFMNTTDPSGVASPLKAFYLNEKRNFFAMSEQDVNNVLSMIGKYVNNLLEG